MTLLTEDNNFAKALVCKYDSGSNLGARIAAGEDVKLKLVAVLQLEALTRPLLPQAAPVALFVCLCFIFGVFLSFVVVLLLFCDILYFCLLL